MKQKLLELLKNTVLEAGEMLNISHKHDMCVSEKTSHRDLVTQYDYQVQELVVERIRLVFPNASFFAEEGDLRGDLTSDTLFILDPIDGTANFACGLNYSAISIALYRNREPFAGVVYNPYNGELFSAAVGQGAYLNDQRIYVSNKPLSESLVVFGTAPYNQECKEDTFKRATLMYRKCQDLRRMGAASLDICNVSAGRFGLYFEASLSLWDYAAAGIILREAGGLLVDFSGKTIPLTGQKTSVIAGRREAIDQSELVSAGWAQ